MYNIDKLYEAVAAKGNVCVGLDTALDYLPPALRAQATRPADALLAYNEALIAACADVAACFKVQIAYYEELGLAGLEVYAKTLKRIRERGCLAIADIKRGDIADTATRYARAHFDGDFEADFVTLSPYMGMDSIEPWLAYAESKGKGAFVLMRTSNQGMYDFEYLELRDGGRLYDAVGDKLAALAERYRGVCGYGAFGAVVGCTEREEAAAIRAKRGNLFFLIPGYGAQGGAADDAALLLRGGNGGVVNASRSILKAWTATVSDTGSVSLDGAAEAARNAAIEMRDALRGAVAASDTRAASDTSAASGTNAKQWRACELIRSEPVSAAQSAAAQADAGGIFRLDFAWDGHLPKAGQFFLIKPERSAVFLARPISVAGWSVAPSIALRFLVAARGVGTEELVRLRVGEHAFLTGPLGNAWAANESAARRESPAPVALISGGIGVAPLAAFARELDSADAVYDFYAGFRAASFGLEGLRPQSLVIATEDGSEGTRGLIPPLLAPQKYRAVYACGPVAMLKAVAALCEAASVPCFVSMERRMACGVGACLGCTIKTRSPSGALTSGANRRCCADGPIFNAKEVVFDE